MKSLLAPDTNCLFEDKDKCYIFRGFKDIKYYIQSKTFRKVDQTRLDNISHPLSLTERGGWYYVNTEYTKYVNTQKY